MADITFLASHDVQDLLAFAHLVKHITFLPPLYNWHLDTGDWQEMTDRVAKSHDNSGRNEAQSPSTVGRAYERYVALSAQNKLLFTGHRPIIQVWTNLLERLNRCDSFSFDLIDHGALTPDLEPYFPAPWNEGFQGTCIGLAVCNPEKNLADLTFWAGLEAMMWANSTIKSFSVFASIWPNSLWEETFFHGRRNFDNLEHLTFGQTQYEFGDLDAEAECHKSLSRIADHLLHRCSRALMTLQFGYREWVDWTKLNVTQLAFGLQQISIGASYISVRCIIAMLTSSPALELLELDSVDLREDDGSNCPCKPLFDAIRDHGRKLEIYMDMIFSRGGQYSIGRFIVDCQASGPKMILDPCANHGLHTAAGKVAARKLPLYLDGKIGWTKELEDGFDES